MQKYEHGGDIRAVSSNDHTIARVNHLSQATITIPTPSGLPLTVDVYFHDELGATCLVDSQTKPIYLPNESQFPIPKRQVTLVHDPI